MKCQGTVSYTIKGLNLFGLVITTKKQLQTCNMNITIVNPSGDKK